MSFWSRMMPGSFPHGQQAPLPTSRSEIQFNSDAMEVVDEENMTDFANKQKVYIKTQRQAHLITQLDILVYVLVGYQLVKYCHSACLIPVIGHILIQKLLCCERFYYGSGGDIRDFLTLINDLDTSELETGVDRRANIDNIANKVCGSIYWKCLISILYHIGFVCFWLVPIANDGKMKLLVNGSWWFVSFIGEPIDSNPGFQDLPYISKLVDLGLLGLVVSDLCILFIQIVLYQSIYRQSTVSPIGRRLLDSEIEVLRAGNSIGGGNGNQLENSTFEPPLALVVRLFEVFSTSAFIPKRDY